MDESVQQFALTQEAAHFIANAPIGQFPDAARMGIKTLIIDTIGVAMAASAHHVGKLVAGFATGASGAATASIFGSSTRASVPMAALANATMANALDFDESFHVSTHVIPTALAIAEQHNLSGEGLIDGAMIGYEFAARLTRAVDAKRAEKKGPTAHGWWHVGLCGPLAAAATAARLMRLDETTIRTALGISTCSSAGLRRNMGTMAKAYHSGQAARAGIEAVTLACSGFTADPSIIESPLGFFAATCGPDGFDESELHNALGQPFVLTKPPRIKAYPACGPGHSLIAVGIQLHERVLPQLDRVERVSADLHTFSLLRPDAEDEEAAGFSGAYLLATALLHGDFNLTHLTPNALQDQRVRNLMTKIQHKRAPKGVEIVEVELSTGETIRAEGKDGPRSLTGDGEIDAKFLSCCSPVIGKAAADELLGRLRQLEAERTLASIMTLARGEQRA